MSSFLKLILIAICFLSIPFIYKKEFKLPPIHAHIPFNPNWAMPSLSDEMLQILQSPFTYFAKGNQSTVFLSADGKYVLKLFRYRRSIFPTLTAVKNWMKKKAKLSLKEKLMKTFNATHLAANEGKEFTQVVYCHLNLTKHELPCVTLKVGKKSYYLPLDHTRFVLQKKVDPFKKALLSAKNNPEEMHRLMESFAKLLLERSKANISNSDPNLGPNFGFLEGQAVEIDFGNYRKVAPNQRRQKEELSRFLISLETWMSKRAPEYYQDAINLRIKFENAYDELNEAPKSIYGSS